MNAETHTKKLEEQDLKGVGCNRRRVEDARFTQGKGKYLDDIKLPDMLFADMVRSPIAHGRIKSINAERALALPGVVAVLTAEDLKPLNLHWMPTLAGDKQAVLADGKVGFQMQEVAIVVAETRYIAADAVDLVEVEYEPLHAITDPHRSLDDDAVVIRDDLIGVTEGAHGPRDHHNHIFTWDAGDSDATEQAFQNAAVTAKEKLYYHRVHPSPLETCGCISAFDKVNEQLTVYVTSQAPHVVRTVFSQLTGITESKIRVVSSDIGGGFGNKVAIYPGYVSTTVASIVLGRPVKWVEDRIENLSTTSFARDYHMEAEIAADSDGRVKAFRVHVIADHGAFDACADPLKFPAGMFHICTSSYDIENAYVNVKGVYTNKSPGGVAYRCSFRVTEGIYAMERMMDILAQKLNMDKAEIRLKNFIKADAFPYKTPLGWEIDSGNYHPALQKVLDAVDYPALLKEQAEKRAKGELMGIGLCTFTEIVGAGPMKTCDILRIGMFDSAEVRIHPTCSAIARFGTISQGQGHQTTFAQILATELGIPADEIKIEEGDTDTAPYGLGTYGSRTTPVGGAAAARAARVIKAKAKRIASYLLETPENELEWNVDRFEVVGNPDAYKTIKDIAWAAYSNLPDDIEPGLEAVNSYNPPNFTYPFGSYLCVVDIDKETGQVHVRRFYALDDCGTRINPMIIEGQIHGGLTEGFAVAMGQELPFDEDGNALGNTFMDFFLPTAVETPTWETDHTVTPSPHHPIGAKGVAESPHVGSIPCFSAAVNDAFAHKGVTHINMPHNAFRVWQTCHELGLDKD